MPTKTVTVDARSLINPTGIRFPHPNKVTIKYLSGTVSVSGIVVNRDAGGDPNYLGKASYFVPGAPEASLCGKIGPLNSFFIGKHKEIAPVGTELGELYLAVNDDSSAAHGIGYGDNSGSFEVEITY